MADSDSTGFFALDNLVARLVAEWFDTSTACLSASRPQIILVCQKYPVQEKRNYSVIVHALTLACLFD